MLKVIIEPHYLLSYRNSLIKSTNGFRMQRKNAKGSQTKRDQ
jgi:hypothetical protein